MSKIISYFFRKYKTSAFLLGVMGAWIFPPFYQIWLLPLSFSGAFALASKAQHNRQAAAIGYWFGFGFFASGFYWIGNALLVDVATFGWLYPITLLGSGAFFGLFTIAPFLLWHCWRGRLVWQIGGFAAIWIVLEWVRSFILTGFPWNLLGTAWAFHPAFIQSASLWGTYGLSFVSLIWAGCAYAAFVSRKKIAFVLFVFIPLLMFVGGLMRMRQYDYGESDIVVRLVQPSIPQQFKWNKAMLTENFETYIDMSRQEGLENIDFVVWGETATPFDLDFDYDYRQQILEAVPSQGHLITGLIRYDFGRYYNSMYVLDKNGMMKGFYDKNHLVPFGEYIPLRRYLPEWIRPVANQIADFSKGMRFQQLKIDNYPVFGALICYEIIFPDAVVDRAQKPDWLVVLTNDGWYGDSAGPYQHLAATQMRAVEEGLTIVRSANSGISAVINPLGEIKASLGYNVSSVLDVRLPAKLKLSTFYGFAQQPLIIFFALLLVLVGVKWNKKC